MVEKGTYFLRLSMRSGIVPVPVVPSPPAAAALDPPLLHREGRLQPRQPLLQAPVLRVHPSPAHTGYQVQIKRTNKKIAKPRKTFDGVK